ncbi:MAG: HEAT repeat domain-containing protein, partial [Verrucomicrobia bacterium]|nr:HEAT repeat domain-containing protein [Verrucomicrobiota bacterium]
RHLRLLPGEAITRKLAAGLDKLPSPSQVQLLCALANRNDPAANEALIYAATGEDQAARLAALAGLARQEGTAENVALLLDAAASRTGPEQAAARDSLIRLRGLRADSALLARVNSGTPALRVEAIQAIGQRGLTEGSAALLQAAHDPVPAVRLAAIKALGQVAGSADYLAMIDLLVQAEQSQEREEFVRAVTAVALRIEQPELRLEPLTDRLSRASVDATTALLPILASLGGPAALKAVQSAAQRKETGIQDAAIRALANWPDASALEILRTIIPSTPITTHRKLALRGFIRVIGLPSQRPAQQIVADYRQALAWATSLDEKRLILAGLAELPHAEALTLVEECARDSSLSAEANLALEKIHKALAQATGAKP